MTLCFGLFTLGWGVGVGDRDGFENSNTLLLPLLTRFGNLIEMVRCSRGPVHDITWFELELSGVHLTCGDEDSPSSDVCRRLPSSRSCADTSLEYSRSFLLLAVAIFFCMTSSQ